MPFTRVTLATRMSICRVQDGLPEAPAAPPPRRAPWARAGRALPRTPRRLGAQLAHPHPASRLRQQDGQEAARCSWCGRARRTNRKQRPGAGPRQNPRDQHVDTPPAGRVRHSTAPPEARPSGSPAAASQGHTLGCRSSGASSSPPHANEPNMQMTPLLSRRARLKEEQAHPPRPLWPATPQCTLRPTSWGFQSVFSSEIKRTVDSGLKYPSRAHAHDCPLTPEERRAPAFTCVQSLSRGPRLHLRVAAGASRPFSWLQKSLQPRKDYRQKGFGP